MLLQYSGRDADLTKKIKTPSASRYSSRKSSKTPTRGNSPQRGLIPPSDLLDYQVDDAPSGTTMSAKERLEEESFERFIQSGLESRRKK